jgi:hypothetical protein
LWRCGLDAKLCGVDDELIYRDELVQLLFNVSDMALSLRNIELLLGGEDGEEEADGD